MNDRVERRDLNEEGRAGHRSRRFALFFRRSLCLAGLATTLSAGACGTSGSGSGEHITQAVDWKGGTIKFGGVTLEVPPGALDTPQVITIEKSNDSPPDGVTALSPVYHFGPDGLKFKLPVTVTISYDGGAEDAVIYWSNDEGGYDQSGMLGLADGAVTTSELHFSSGFVSHLSKYRFMPCDNDDNARQLRASCKLTRGDICLDNYPSIPIQYVFVLMQENRSFDNYFGRFQAYLKKKKYDDARTKPGGLEVPATPYELLDAAGKAQEDQKLDLCSYDPKKDAPYNPAKAGVSPGGACDKHYWRHAQGDGEQCVSDTCHEWWCAHLQVDSGRMDGFFQSNDGFWEGSSPNVGYPPNPIPDGWYDYSKYPNKPNDGSLLRGDRAMLYYDENDIPFYYWLADAYGLADHYHSSVIGPTFVNRDYLYGATSRGLTSNSSDSYGGSSTFAYKYAGDQTANPAVVTYKITDDEILPLNTIYDDLNIRGVGYTQWVRNRYSNVAAVAKYGAWYGGATALASDSHKYTYDAESFGGKGLEYYVQQENKLLANAIKNGKDPWTIKPQGKVYPVNFIDPDVVEDVNGEDEHPPGTPQMGQRLTYDILRILMSNPEVWKRSVLFITWDEHGGFYDHVEPPKACAPDNIKPVYSGAYGGGPKTAFSDGEKAPRAGSVFLDNSDKLYPDGFAQYGVRVPLLVISPWVKHQYVSHNTYDHTSVVRFIEARFGLPALTNRDANADPLFDFFDFTSARDKLRGAAAADPTCLNCNGGKWGTETIPQDPAFTDASLPATTSNGACQILFPPIPLQDCGLGCQIGANVYGGYDWSRGAGPPAKVQCGGGGGCCMVQPCPLNYKWCASDCDCATALQCPPGDFELGGCECCAQFDSIDPLTCISCDSKEDVFDTYCPGG